MPSIEMRAPAKHLFTLLVVTASVVMLYVMTLTLAPVLISETQLEVFLRPKGEMVFDPVVWKRTTPGDGERYKMVDDLLRRRLLVSRNQEEVLALLGEPNLVASINNEPALYYVLGSQSDYPARSSVLPLKLGNLESWILAVHFQGGRSCLATVKVD